MKKLLILLTISFFSIQSFAQDTLTEREDFYRELSHGKLHYFSTGYSHKIGVDKKSNQPKTNRKGAGNDSTLFWFSESFDWEKIDTAKLGYFDIGEQDSFFIGISFYHPDKFTNDSLKDFKDDYSFLRQPGYGYLVYTISGFKTYTELYNFILANKDIFYVGDEYNQDRMYRVMIYSQVLKAEPIK